MANTACPVVTIGIPTYNRANSYLQCALESAIDQTYPNIEIVVSDNCSPDRTTEVVQAFSDPRIRYFKHTENIGANNNFNFCVEQAKGDYFLLLHDDDLIDSDFVATCMESVNYGTDVGVVFTGSRVVDSDGHVLQEAPNMVGGLSTTDFFLGWFKGETSLYLCSTLFNTARLEEIGRFKSKHNLFQDVVAEVQLAAKFGRVDVEDIKASFRKHTGERTSAAKISSWCEDSRSLLDLMCDLVPTSDAPLIRREGRRFFSRLNYRFASAVESPRKRLASYLVVYKTFDYRYSPLYFSVYEKRMGLVQRIVGKARRMLAGDA